MASTVNLIVRVPADVRARIGAAAAAAGSANPSEWVRRTLYAALGLPPEAADTRMGAPDPAANLHGGRRPRRRRAKSRGAG